MNTKLFNTNYLAARRDICYLASLLDLSDLALHSSILALRLLGGSYKNRFAVVLCLYSDFVLHCMKNIRLNHGYMPKNVI